MRLGTHFARNSLRTFQSDTPLTEVQMRTVAPSIYAEEKHGSRSERYTYIPTADILQGLRHNGFEPFMVAQSQSRIAGKTEFTKHMVRLRHATSRAAGGEAKEVILINSHDGTSSYQLMAGVFRFVCTNGLVCGEVSSDIRVPHKGNIQDQVIDGAFRVLDDFDRVDESVDAMKSLTLAPAEQELFAQAALTLRFGERPEGQPAAPVLASDLNRARRSEDRDGSLWTTFQRVQENAVQGGLRGRSANGARIRTRPIEGIDGNTTLNRALWMLAEGMRKLKG